MMHVSYVYVFQQHGMSREKGERGGDHTVTWDWAGAWKRACGQHVMQFTIDAMKIVEKIG